MITNSNPVIICETDLNKLKEIVKLSKNAEEQEGTLAYELNRAIIVKDGELPEKTIRIGAAVVVADAQSGKEHAFQIVMPEEANIQDKKISVLSPMAAAIIGFKEGDEVHWKMPAGFKTLKILQVKNG